MKVNLRDATVVSASVLLAISITIVAAPFGSAFSQAPAGGNMTASNPNAT